MSESYLPAERRKKEKKWFIVDSPRAKESDGVRTPICSRRLRQPIESEFFFPKNDYTWIKHSCKRSKITSYWSRYIDWPSKINWIFTFPKRVTPLGALLTVLFKCLLPHSTTYILNHHNIGTRPRQILPGPLVATMFSWQSSLPIGRARVSPAASPVCCQRRQF